MSLPPRTNTNTSGSARASPGNRQSHNGNNKRSSSNIINNTSRRNPKLMDALDLPNQTISGLIEKNEMNSYKQH
jgi:hypothetical protein